MAISNEVSCLFYIRLHNKTKLHAEMPSIDCRNYSYCRNYSSHVDRTDLFYQCLTHDTEKYREGKDKRMLLKRAQDPSEKNISCTDNDQE